jgi:uncharacterized protein
VVSCVNGVGVDLNRASAQLADLCFRAGPVPGQEYRGLPRRPRSFPSQGRIARRARPGAQGLRAGAGFLRIPAANNPLDASAVHPESYPVVDAMAADLDCTVADLLKECRAAPVSI